jgi:uncharacterized membrane protein YozB (DUF420 family)
MTIQDLPLINACLNALATVFLMLGFVFIKKGNKIAHRNCMISAFVTSAVFLTCYLIYHYNTGSTKFVEPAWFKPIYFTILITHIILAVVILPLIFMTLSRALKERFPQHKKNSQVDVAAVDVRLNHRRADLPPALPDFPTAQAPVAPTTCRRAAGHRIALG